MIKFYEFVPNEKRPLYQYEDGVKSMPNFSNKSTTFTDCGLKIPSNVVVVDLDNHNQDKIVEKKLKEIVNYLDTNYPTFKVTTDSGYHLYYKKTPKQDIKNSSYVSSYGIPVEFKSNCYVTIKRNGKLRDTNKPIEELKFSDLPELPIELYPIPKSKNLVILGMGEGDRDNTLFNHLMNVKETIKDIDISKIAHFINDYLFEIPLKENEIKAKIDNVLERKSSDNNYYDGKNINIREFANFLIENEHICIINNQLYVFNGEVYVCGSDNIERVMLKYISNILSAKRIEVLKMLLLIAPKKEYSSENFIAFKNGIYDLDTNVLLGFSTEFIVPNQIPHNYNPNANNDYVNMILNTWVSNNEDTRILLDECIGMTMYRSNKLGACFILTGNKDNGKSTFRNMLIRLLGKENCSSIGLHDIEQKFSNFNIVGKLANLGDDIGDTYISKTENFKKLVTGETVQLEKKGKDHIEYENYAKLIFNANEIPNIKDPTGAVIDKRIIMIPFNTHFTRKNKDVNLDKKFKTDENIMETLINIGIAGIKRVIENNGFSSSLEATNLKEEYKKSNDIVLSFIEEYEKENIYNYDEKPILIAFQEFCKDNNSPSSSQKILRAGIKKHLNSEIRRRNTNVSEQNNLGLQKRQKIPYYSDKLEN